MKISIELSLYPLSAEPVAEVLRFIGELQAQDLRAAGIEMTVNQMSTQLTGELGAVFAVLERALRRSFDSPNGQALVAKILNKALPIGEPPDLSPPGPS